jgi:hypothetical protein
MINLFQIIIFFRNKYNLIETKIKLEYIYNLQYYLKDLDCSNQI